MDREGNLDHCGNSFNPLPFEQRRGGRGGEQGGRGGGREGGGGGEGWAGGISVPLMRFPRRDLTFRLLLHHPYIPPLTPIHTSCSTVILLPIHSFTESFIHYPFTVIHTSVSSVRTQSALLAPVNPSQTYSQSIKLSQNQSVSTSAPVSNPTSAPVSHP